MRSVAVWALAIVLAIAPLAGSAGVRTAMLLLAAILLAVMVYRDPKRFAGPLPRAVFAAFAAWAGFALASLAWSIDPAYTRGELRAEVLYGALAFAAFFLAARMGTWRLWQRALLLGTLAILVLQVLQHVSPITISRHSVTGQSGLWSTHLVIVAPFVLALGWPGLGNGSRGSMLQAAALIVLFGAAWQTGNRAIWVALAAQIAVATALASRLFTIESRSRGLAVPAIAAVLVALSFILAVGDRLSVAPGAAFANIFAVEFRPQIWSVAWQQIFAAPWLGHGFGREIVAAAFAPISPPAALQHPPIGHSHNLFLDMALQLGVVGLCLFLVLLAALARHYRACLRDPGTFAFGVLGLTLLVGFVLKNLTDDFLIRHNGLMFWALNGVLLGLVRPPAPGSIARARALPENSANASDPTVDFTCNVCGTVNQRVSLRRAENRETPSCSGCDSTLRQRALAYLVSLELHGRPLTLPQFPVDRRIRGLGLSDWEGLAAGLARKVDYTNTFYTRAPQLDICAIPADSVGKYRFLIASDVFEHIPHFAIDESFRNSRRLLGEGGFFIFTVPYVTHGETREFFPRLHDFRIAEKEGRRVLLNTTIEGEKEAFDDLDFHGGEGMTLAMRMFAEGDLLRRLRAAGFSSVHVHDERYAPYAIIWPPGMDHSLPIVARV